MTGAIAWDAAAISDQGRRPNNEDCVLAEPQAGVFAVIDGIGGGPYGERAAAIARDILRERLLRTDAPPERRLREAIALANNEIFRCAQASPEMRGCGCVLAAAIVEDGTATVAHVGDARAYLLRRGRIRRLTFDHSPAGEMERRGEISEDQVARHPGNHQVYREVGGADRDLDDPGFIEVGSAGIGLDGALLLCSDGLSDALSSEDIRTIVESSAGGTEHTAAQLVAAALESGSRDNISVVYAEGPAYRFDLRTSGQPRHRVRRRRLLVLLLAAAFVLAIASWMVRCRILEKTGSRRANNFVFAPAGEASHVRRIHPGRLSPGRTDQ